MTILQSLKSLNAYPIPQLTVESIAKERGLNIEGEATEAVQKGAMFRLAKADIYKWLSIAPNISQSGISYSFSENERKSLRSQADAIYNEFGIVDSSLTKFGYKGELL